MHDEYLYPREIIERLTVAKLVSILTERERDIIYLWASNEFTFEEMGRIIGQKYHGRDLPYSLFRYHVNITLTKIRSRFGVPSNELDNLEDQTD